MRARCRECISVENKDSSSSGTVREIEKDSKTIEQFEKVNSLDKKRDVRNRDSLLSYFYTGCMLFTRLFHSPYKNQKP